MQISQCVPKEELAPLSLDVIQDSWRWLTHKSGQNVVAIGRYASILRRKDVTIACMRPINHVGGHCHWLTRDAAAKSLPLPLSLATKLLAKMGRLLVAVECRTEVQAGNILGCICIIHTSNSSSSWNPSHHILLLRCLFIPDFKQLYLLVPVEACVCVWLSVWGRGANVASIRKWQL